ncbi:sugar transferase [Pelagibacteraceae bacterium]|nr:sugar transferase [Pelagibacteraceae bacterium]|tara:strand:- start:473 stop:1063 length:591 start_codon:yes stop_codon:yes gene_type:complete
MLNKRIFDISLIIITFPLTFFLFLIIMILNFFINGTPVFFYQNRVGYKNKIFTIYKFRTMPLNNDFNDKILSLSKWNKFLRNSSLDEIPELYNVFKGEMSLVGPRPLLVEYLKIYNDKNIKRHNTLPGITGLSQVSGRNKISWKEKFQYDLYYVNNKNIFLDIIILLKTIFKLFAYKDNNFSENIAMEKFSEKSEQ